MYTTLHLKGFEKGRQQKAHELSLESCWKKNLQLKMEVSELKTPKF